MRSFRPSPLIAILLVALVAGAVATATLTGVFGSGSPGGSGQSDAAQATPTEHPFARRFKLDDTTVQTCASKGDENRQACRQQAIGNIAMRNGADAAYKRLDALLVSDPTWVVDTHVITHSIGAATLARNQGSIGKTFADGAATGSMAGSAGFYHGVILQTLRGVPQDKIGKRAAQVCREPDVEKVRFLKYQCLHGTGHGLMIYTGYDLPFALKACGDFGNARDTFDCKTGIFMENYSEFLGVQSGIRSNYLKQDDLLYPCNWVPGKDDKEACYVQVVDRIGPGLNWDWRAVANECRRVETEFRGNCFDSYGLWVENRAKSEPAGILQLCTFAAQDERQCVYGAARAMIGNDLEGARTRVRVAKLCNGAPADVQAYCFYGVGTVLQQLGQKRFYAGCQAIAPLQFQDECRKGQGPTVGA